MYKVYISTGTLTIKNLKLVLENVAFETFYHIYTRV